MNLATFPIKQQKNYQAQAYPLASVIAAGYFTDPMFFKMAYGANADFRIIAQFFPVG